MTVSQSVRSHLLQNLIGQGMAHDDADKFVLIVSDMHVGSAYGLMPRGFRGSTSATINLNTGQEYLLEQVPQPHDCQTRRRGRRADDGGPGSGSGPDASRWWLIYVSLVLGAALGGSRR